MPNKMERFTQRARRVLSLAQEETERLEHRSIDTGHVLLGILREEGGVGGRVLRDLGIELRRATELLDRLTDSDDKPDGSNIDLSAGTKKMLELAVDEARRMGHHYIGTEHLLLGLVRQQEGTAIEILRRLGVSPEEVRRQTRRVLSESPKQTTQPPTQSTSQPQEKSPTYLASWQVREQALPNTFSPLTLSDQFRWIQFYLNTDDTEGAPTYAISEEEWASRSGGNKMQRFTQRARRVLSLSQEEAERYQHDKIYAAHLLMGLLREDGGVAGRVLRELQVEQRPLEQLISTQLESKKQRGTGSLDLSDGVKRTLELAVDVARQLGHHYIGTEHLLIGFTRLTDDDFVPAFLEEFDLTVEDVLRRTIRVLQESPLQQSTRSQQRPQTTLSPQIQLDHYTNLLAILDDSRAESIIEREVDQLTRQYERQMTDYARQYSESEAFLEQSVGELVPYQRLLLRRTLTSEPMILQSIKQQADWLRVTSALVGGYANYRTNETIREYFEMRNFFAQNQITQRYYLESVSYEAKFDVSRWRGENTDETITNMRRYFDDGMDGRIKLTTLPPIFSPANIWHDSELSQLLLRFIRQQKPVTALLTPLQQIIESSQQAELKAEALVLLLMLGEDVIPIIDQMRTQPGEIETVNYIVRHLQFLQEMLGDAVARSVPHATQLLTALSVLAIPTEQQIDLLSTVIETLIDTGYAPIPMEAAQFNHQHPYVAGELWAYLLCGYDDNANQFLIENAPTLAASVDPIMGITALHLAHNLNWQAQTRWTLEILPPRYDDTTTLEQVGDYITTVANIVSESFDIDVIELLMKTFLQPYVDDYPALQTEIIIALLVIPRDMYKELVTKITGVPDWGNLKREALIDRLLDTVETIDNPIIKGRCLWRMAMLYHTWRDQPLFQRAFDSLTDDMPALSIVRACERLLPHLGNRTPALYRQLKENLNHLDTENQARSLARLSQMSSADDETEILLRKALARIADMDDPTRTMQTLHELRPLIAQYPDIILQSNDLCEAQPDKWLDYRGRGLSSLLLLNHHAELHANTLMIHEAWNPLIIMAVCREVTAYFSVTETPQQIWQNLLDEQEADAAVDYLFEYYRENGVSLNLPIAETIDSLINQGRIDLVKPLLNIIQKPTLDTRSFLLSWQDNYNETIASHAGLLLAESGRYNLQIIQSTLRLLEIGDDRARIRAAIALHGDNVFVDKPNRGLRASQLGIDALYALTRYQEKGSQNASYLSTIIDWSWVNMIHDDVSIAERLLKDAQNDAGRGDDARSILSSIYEATPEVNTLLLDRFAELNDDTQVSLIWSFANMVYIKSAKGDNVMSQISDSISQLNDEQRQQLVALPNRATAVQQVLTTISRLPEPLSPAGIKQANDALDTKYITIAWVQITQFAQATKYAVNSDPKLARTAAEQITRNPDQFELLIHWLDYALSHNDEKSIRKHQSALLEVAAPAAALLPSGFRNLARELELESKLIRAAKTHASYVARAAAIDLLSCLTRIHTPIDDLLVDTLRDVELVQSAALRLVNTISEVDEAWLPSLANQLTNTSTTVAYAAIRLMTMLGRNERLSSDGRNRIIHALSDAIRNERAKRPVYFLQGGTNNNDPLHAAYITRLDEIYYQALTQVTGMFV